MAYVGPLEPMTMMHVTIEAGKRVTWPSAYGDALIERVSKNGWCRLRWDDGREFTARAHWIANPAQYTIVPGEV